MNIERAITKKFDDCIIALNNYDIDSAYRYLQNAKSYLSNLNKRHILWAYYYVNLSSIYNNIGNFYASIDYCNKAKKIIKKHKDKRLEAKIASNMSSAYFNLSDYNNAQNYVLKAIDIYQKKTQKEALAAELLSLAQILLRQGKWSQAIKKCSKALLLAKKNNGNKQVQGK